MRLLTTGLLLTAALSLSGPKLEFVHKRLINYGDIIEGEMASISIAIKNTGDKDLLILSAFPSCNCSSIDYPKNPISPGSFGSIAISIDTHGKSGSEIIVVKFLTNTKERYSVIRIDLNVIPRTK